MHEFRQAQSYPRTCSLRRSWTKIPILHREHDTQPQGDDARLSQRQSCTECLRTSRQGGDCYNKSSFQNINHCIGRRTTHKGLRLARSLVQAYPDTANAATNASLDTGSSSATAFCITSKYSRSSAALEGVDQNLSSGVCARSEGTYC